MKITKEGKRFILATFLISIAAINTGNNLLYLILAMMLSILILSILILVINMKGLSLRILQPEPVFVNNQADIKIIILNKKRFFPSNSIKISMPSNIIEEAYLWKIPVLSEIEAIIKVLYKKRGVYTSSDFILQSSYPFIFFIVSKKYEGNGQIVVYPEIKKIKDIFFETITEGSEKAYHRIGQQDDISFIREFRYGDDWRKIHWKATAKTEKLMFTEYSSDEPRKLTVILDNLMPQNEESFEKAISFASSISDMFIREDYFVRLLTCKTVIPFGRGREHLFKILYSLAVLEGQYSWECPMSEKPQGITILILNTNNSPLSRFISYSNMVVYAADL